MRHSGFTLIELLIVIVIVALLAALLLPALSSAICAAKEARASTLIHDVEGAAKMYERDFNQFPADMTGNESGLLVYALGKPGAKKQPYISFVESDLSDWDSGNNEPTQQSHIRNPVDITQHILYEDNTDGDSFTGGSPPVHNKYGIDLWCSDCAQVATGINNWRKDQ